MNDLTIIKKNGGAYIDSREVAVAISKAHGHLMRDIHKYCGIIASSTQSIFGLSDFFVENTYFDRTGRELPCYLLTKMGCELVAHKLTGEKGVMFTAMYVAKFNAMEAAERERELKEHGKPRLSEFNSAVRNVLSGMSYTYATPASVMSFLRGVYKPLGIAVSDDSFTPCFYTVTDIARMNGIYSESGRPHGHAVAAIISKMHIPESRMIVVPYGLVGVTFRYNSDVMSAVWDWIVENGYPHLIPYLDFDYHIYYKRNRDEDNFCFNLDEDDDDLDDDYTAAELDAMCGKFGECDECPGFLSCCEAD